MKRLHIFLPTALLALASLASCSDWLDVNPRSQVKSDILLTTEDGFKSALMGAYIDLSSQELYGYNTSFYFPECLSRTWTVVQPASGSKITRDKMYYISNYNYTQKDIEPEIDKIWTKYYNTISELNNVIENIEKNEVGFQYDNDKLILGEALGLRAFCHMEVLRFFGPVPTASIDQGQPAIPYVKHIRRTGEELVTVSYSEVITNIEKDLNRAQEILAGVDPILKYTNQILNQSPKPEGPVDPWQYYRQNRFNYYAVVATKARLYNWTGDRAQSYENAMKVIEGVTSDSKRQRQFALTTETTFDNLVMRTEHIMAIHRPTLEVETKAIFGEESAYITQTVANINKAYENTLQPNDIRIKLSRYWEEKVWGTLATKINHFKKYTGNQTVRANNMVPLIRLSEMYFIGMENAPSIAQAGVLFSDYRVARALTATTFDGVIDQASLILRLEKEYRKEFMGEGQMFFFYKKQNYAKFTWPSTFTLPKGAYVVPMPKSQTNFE